MTSVVRGKNLAIKRVRVDNARRNRLNATMLRENASSLFELHWLQQIKDLVLEAWCLFIARVRKRPTRSVCILVRRGCSGFSRQLEVNTNTNDEDGQAGTQHQPPDHSHMVILEPSCLSCYIYLGLLTVCVDSISTTHDTTVRSDTARGQTDDGGSGYSHAR